MGKRNRTLDLHAVARARAPHRASEISQPIRRQQRGMLKRRDKIAARQVRPVVLHAVEGRFDLRRIAFKRPGQSLPNAGELPNHPRPFARKGRHANGKEEFGGKPRLRISRHRHMVDLTDRYAGFLQAVTDRSGRETGGVLDAVEALFLNGGDQSSVTNEGRRGIAVVSVDPENVHRATKKVYLKWLHTEVDQPSRGRPRPPV